MARPRKTLDKEKIKQLAAVGLCTAEIAAVLECSPDTLERRFMAVMESGRQRRNASLRRKQYEVAVGGNPTMLIWLGKQFLGQNDKMEVAGHVGVQLVSSVPRPVRVVTTVLPVLL